jgi:hypothetical protein
MNRIKERFIQNSKGFWSGYRWMLALYCIALLADGISTIRFMLTDGVETELHPGVNIVARITGPVLGPLIGVFGKAAAGVIVAIYWRSIAWIILLAASIISLWAAWYNTWGWQYYEPGIIKWWPFG